MSAKQAITVHGLASNSWLHLDIPPEYRAAFTELVQRGANLWPDAPAVIKELADLVTNGRELQDYQRFDRQMIQPPESTTPPSTTLGE